jgi:hypothetical protein
MIAGFLGTSRKLKCLFPGELTGEEENPRGEELFRTILL